MFLVPTTVGAWMGLGYRCRRAAPLDPGPHAGVEQEEGDV